MWKAFAIIAVVVLLAGVVTFVSLRLIEPEVTVNETIVEGDQPGE